MSTPTFSDGTATATTTAKVSAATSIHTHAVTTSGSVSIEYTPKGTINNHIYTPAGTVSKPIYTGTGVRLVGSFSGSQGSITYTPAGTISDTTIKVDLAKQIMTTTNPLNVGESLTEQLNMSLSSLVDVEV